MGREFSYDFLLLTGLIGFLKSTSYLSYLFFGLRDFLIGVFSQACSANISLSTLILCLRFLLDDDMDF